MKKLVSKRILITFTSVLLMSGLFTPHSTYAAQTVSGTQDNIVDVTPITSPSILTFTYSGEGVFSASPVDGSGKEGLPYQLQIGEFNGTYFQRSPSKPIVAIAVKGTGDWKITINPLKSAPVLNAKSGSGNGATVFSIGKPSSGIKRISWSHSGEGVFSVFPIDAKGRQKLPLFLKIGNYSGTVMLPSGTQYFEVKADGDWQYSIK